jgi:hypothetical protein
MRNISLFAVLISLTLGSLQADYILQIEFKANSDQTSPSRIPLEQNTKLSFDSGENEIHRSGGSRGIDTRYEPDLQSTHKTSYSIRIYKNDINSEIRMTYEVNQEKGEVVTLSLPIEIKCQNYRFKSHPNNPYTLIIKLSPATGEKDPE